MAINLSVYNLGVSSDYYPGKLIQTGTDPYTGEKIIRQKTFIKVNVPGHGYVKIDEAINDMEPLIRNAAASNNVYKLTSLLSQKAELLTIRGYGTDRSEAYKILTNLLETNLEKYPKLDGIPPLAKVQIADLVLNQLNDNETPAVPLETAINMCVDGRQKLESPNKNKAWFFIAEGYLDEAKLRALRNNPNLDTDEALNGLMEKAKIDWETIKNDVSNNPNIIDRELNGGVDAVVKIEETRKGMIYLQASAKIEQAKLIAQIAQMPREKEAEDKIKAKINGSIALCREAQKQLIEISRNIYYVYHDAVLTEADLIAKLARIDDDDKIREDGKSVYKLLSENSQFSDIKSLSSAGVFSLDIELSKFKWEDVDRILKDYFDPTAGTNNLKYPFDSHSYSYMSIETLEAQLRNEVKRTKFEIPGGILPRGPISDYRLAQVRTQHVRENIDKVKALRDKFAITDLKARAMFQEARATALMADAETSNADKIDDFNKAITELETIIKTVLGEDPETIPDNKGKMQMDGTFYVGLWETWGNYFEQIAWLKNKDKDVKDFSLFDPACKKYNETAKLCAYSKSKYDKGQVSTVSKYGREIFTVPSARGKLLYITMANIETAKLETDIVVSDPGKIRKIITSIDDLVKIISAFKVPEEISAIQAELLLANVNRMKVEALCKKLFFVNMQKASVLADAGISDQAAETVKIFGEIKKVADTVLPLGPGAKSALEDTYYPVMNMLGANSVCLRFDKEGAATAILNYYKTYIKGKSVKITYDMVDALANAAVLKKDKGLQADVIKYLDGLIDPQKTASVITRAKAYVWKARLQSWFYDERDLDLNKPDLLKGAVSDYVNALEAYKGVTAQDAEKLYQNGASKLALMDEKALAEFMYANATKKGEANAAARTAEYARVAGDINNKILIGSSDTSGLTAETTKKVQKQDAAAKIKSKLTLISIVMSLAEPISKGLVSTVELKAAVKGICGKDAASESEIFEVAKTKFNEVIASLEDLGRSMTGTEMASLGIDVPSVYRQAAQNYMILALKTSEAVKILDEADKVDKQLSEKLDSVENYKGTEISQSELDKRKAAIKLAQSNLSAGMDKVGSKKDDLIARYNGYVNEMNRLFGEGLDKAKGNNIDTAELKLVQAQFAGWTAGGDVKKLGTADDLYKQAEGAYKGVMDKKAKMDHASVLMDLTFNEVNRQKDAMTLLDDVQSDPGLIGAKASVGLANFTASAAEKDVTKLKAARQYMFDALRKLTTYSKTDAQGYVDLIGAAKITDRAVVQALCILGTIESRIFFEKANTDRLKEYKESLETLLNGIYGIIKLYESDISLKAEISEFKKNQDEVYFSWVDALPPEKQTGIRDSDEFKKRKQRKDDYSPIVDSIVERMKDIQTRGR